MTSPFEQLFSAVCDRLQNHVTELNYVNQDFGQLKDQQQLSGLAFPCVLVDLDEFNFEDFGAQIRQKANGTVVLRLVFSVSEQATPSSASEALEQLRIEQDIMNALHRWKVPGLGTTIRRKIKTEEREDALRVRAITFQITYLDETLMKAEHTSHTPVPVIRS